MMVISSLCSVTRLLSFPRRLFDEDDPEYTTTLHNIANCYDKAGDMRSAEELYRRTTTWLEERARSPRAYAGILVDLAGAYCGLSAVLAKQYKDTEAESAVTRAIELYTDNLPPNHPFIARSLQYRVFIAQNHLTIIYLYRISGAYLKMANLLSFTNHSAEAQKYCTMALAILKTTLGPDHHETLDAAEFCKMLTTAKTQHAAAQKQGSSTKANAGTTPTSSQGFVYGLETFQVMVSLLHLYHQCRLSHLRLRVWAVVGLFAAVAAGAFWASGRVLGR
jgi:tetratricopeptide (TPR) repeat protein